MTITKQRPLKTLRRASPQGMQSPPFRLMGFYCGSSKTSFVKLVPELEIANYLSLEYFFEPIRPVCMHLHMFKRFCIHLQAVDMFGKYLKLVNAKFMQWATATLFELSFLHFLTASNFDVSGYVLV